MATVATTTARPATLALVLLIGLAILLNYIDRGAIAIASPVLKPELGLSNTEYGYAVSAFFWTYVPIQFFIGWACDRWCVYRLIAIGIAVWALSTLAMGLVGGLLSLVIFRLFLGLGESITFPGASKVIARHVAPENRGLANSVVAAGIALGPVVGTFAGGLMVASYGWRPMFVVFGLITLLWVIPWLLTARRLPTFAPAGREPPVPIRITARTKEVWAMGIGHFGATYPLYFIIIWVPLYLTKTRGFSITDMTYLATLGFIAQALSAVGQGWLSDRLVRAGRDEALVRRTLMVGGNVMMAVSILALMQAEDAATIGLWLVIFGAAAATGGVNLYAIAQIFAGPRASGTFIGIQNGLGNVPGIIMPIVTGLIIDWTGSYDNAFKLTAAVCAAAALWWLIGVPKIRRVIPD
ncbi:MFS transporter [Sphingomonas sp. RB56-2]|uniref:MFS transporter n=1 Tax=Sphingomonas brevis TaxID=2908206 RepID=A0ABT0S5A3_9SPHN|nr:MFS transporter [Sphingomonas brevis]MCL6739575.1 MFS transporter [Sphingomonas brevis]